MLAANINVSNYPNMSKMFFQLGKVDGGCGLWLHTPKNQRLEPFGINDWDLICQIPGGWIMENPMENPNLKIVFDFGFPKLPADDWPLSMGESKLWHVGMITPATWAEFDHVFMLEICWNQAQKSHLKGCHQIFIGKKSKASPHPSPHRLNPPGETLMLLVNPNRTVGHGQPQTWIGGWRFQSLWKILVNWDDEIPNIWKNKKCSKPPIRIG